MFEIRNFFVVTKKFLKAKFDCSMSGASSYEDFVKSIRNKGCFEKMHVSKINMYSFRVWAPVKKYSFLRYQEGL